MASKKKYIGLFTGILFILMVGIVGANELQVDLNTPLIIKASCMGEDASMNIMIYSGTTQDPDNLVKERTDMIRLSPSDFVFTKSFESTGVFTAYEECIYGGGFASEQTTTITVTDFMNLIQNTTLHDYKYKADLYYDVYFKADPTKDKTIKFDLGTEIISFQPKELNIVNSADTKKQTIKTPQRGTISTANNVVSYNNVYGNGLSLLYNINSKYVKEDLKISNASVLPVAHNDLVNPLLEMNFEMVTTTRHFFVDGSEWDIEHVNKITTSNKIVIKDDYNNTVYVLEVPVAYDGAGEHITGVYSLERDGADKVKVAVKMPYNWFKDTARVFPIMVDPTLDTPDGTSYFGDSTPIISVEDFIIPAGIPYMINETVLIDDVIILDAECELNIIDDSTGLHAIDFRSFYNDGQGSYMYIWEEPYAGSFTLDQYCWRGDTLLLNKIYSLTSINVYE